MFAYKLIKLDVNSSSLLLNNVSFGIAPGHEHPLDSGASSTKGGKLDHPRRASVGATLYP